MDKLEIQLVKLFPIEQLLYVRMGPTPAHGAYRVAYTLLEDQTIGREWYLYHDWHDGIELMPNDINPMVRADSIALNTKTVYFDIGFARRLTAPKPQRLLERWQQYHADHPRVINLSLWARVKRWRKRNVTI